VTKPGADRLTIAELSLGYYRYCERYYVKNGRATNQVRMIRLSLRVLRRLYGGTPAKDFGPLSIRGCPAEFIFNQPMSCPHPGDSSWQTRSTAPGLCVTLGLRPNSSPRQKDLSAQMEAPTPYGSCEPNAEDDRPEKRAVSRSYKTGQAPGLPSVSTPVA
jgi:hypothetical protein